MTKTMMFALVLAGACVEQTPDDPIDDTVIGDGKADASDYVEGSVKALAILKVANDTSLDDLKSKAGISTRAANGIVAARPLATLAALDAVPYVGHVTFDKIAAYADRSVPHVDFLPPGAISYRGESQGTCGASHCGGTRSCSITCVVKGDNPGSIVVSCGASVVICVPGSYSNSWQQVGAGFGGSQDVPPGSTAVSIFDDYDGGPGRGHSGSIYGTLESSSGNAQISIRSLSYEQEGFTNSGVGWESSASAQSMAPVVLSAD